MTHRRQVDGSTRAHAQVHMRLLYGHQGIMHIGHHHREAACFMGPHGYRPTSLGASTSASAPRSLRTTNFGAVGPMCHSGGLCVYRAGQWLVSGLHTIQWTAETCLTAGGHRYCGFGYRLASYGAPTALGACIKHCLINCHRRASGGPRCQNGTCSLHQ